MRKGTKIEIDEDYDGYMALAGAILNQAWEDYKSAIRQGKYKQASDIERFFLSGWGQQLSFGHGEGIVRKCKEYRARIMQKKRNR